MLKRLGQIGSRHVMAEVTCIVLKVYRVREWLASCLNVHVSFESDWRRTSQGDQPNRVTHECGKRGIAAVNSLGVRDTLLSQQGTVRSDWSANHQALTGS